MPQIKQHDPAGVMQYQNRYQAGKALIVLGGSSAKGWEKLRDEIQPDVILGGNGVNAIVPNLDYWMIVENMKRSAKRADMGDLRAKVLMEMFHRSNGARVKLVSHWSWHLLRDTANCICVKRKGYDLDQIPEGFTFREYTEGFLAGGLSKYTEVWQPNIHVRPGTVGLQLLHMAGVLGVREIHTIGFDLCFRSKGNHHAYLYPTYRADVFRTEKMFTHYKGLDTQWIWIETAEYLRGIEPIMERDGILWRDHSDGLLQKEGLQCAQ